MADVPGSAFPIVEVHDEGSRWFRWSGQRRDIFRPTTETFYWQFTLGSRLQCPQSNERERCLFAFVRELYDLKIGDVAAQWSEGRFIEYQYANIKLGDVFAYYTTRNGVLRVPQWRSFAYAVEEFLEKDPRAFIYRSRIRPMVEERSTLRLEPGERKSGADTEELLQVERAARVEDNKKFNSEITALMEENALLREDLSRKDEELQQFEEQVRAQKEMIQGLDHALREEQETGLQKLKEKQEEVEELEIHLQDIARSSRASSFGYGSVGFGPEDRLRVNKHELRVTGDDGEGEEPTTPGTPVSSSSGELLPPLDPRADQVVQDWTNDRTLRAARNFDEGLAFNQMHELVAKLPYESQEDARRVLTDLLDPTTKNTAVDESEILLHAVPVARQQELREFLIPVLKAHHALRVSYATLERRTVVTDVRIKIERRQDSDLAGNVPGEKRFGRGHAFQGPSSDNAGKLVPHGPRALSSSNKAMYVSKPKHADPNAPSPREGSEPSTDDMDSSSEISEVPSGVSPSSKKWRGLGAAKLLGTMAAGAKQRVTTFKNSKFVHEGTSCQYCKMLPIVGERYSCETCVGFSLCKSCYSRGGHGLENSDDLFYRTEDIVLKRCPRLEDQIDLLELLRFEICRSNLRMFSFCLNWLADIINGKSSRDLKARALEMPGIRRDIRKIFVPMLMEACSHRQDIKIMTEMETEDDSADDDDAFIETLRIWIADKYRSTSPFAKRDQLQEGGEGGEESDSNGDSAHGDHEIPTPRGDDQEPMEEKPEKDHRHPVSKNELDVENGTFYV